MKFLKRAFIFGIPVTLSLSLGWLISMTDKVLISSIVGVAAAGYYGAVSELITQLLTLGFVIPYTALYPLIIRLSGAEQSLLLRRKQETFHFWGTLIVLGGLMMSLAASIFPQRFGVLVWGMGYVDIGSELVSPLVVSGCLLCFKTFFVDVVFHLYMRTTNILYISLCTAVLNIALGLYFVTAYGLQGAAWATLLSLGFGLFVSLVFACKLDYSLFLGMKNKIAFAVIALGAVYFFCQGFTPILRFVVFLGWSMLIISCYLYANRRLWLRDMIGK